MIYQELVIYFCIFLIAYLYASVGHGGASGYLAIMGLFAVSASIMRPSALLMNCIVSLLAFFQYSRAGHFQWKLFIPFAITSVPAAFWGGSILLDDFIYKKVLAVLLLISIFQLLKSNQNEDPYKLKPSPIYLCLMIGAAIGFFSGLIGIGGGILLSPLIIFLKWASLKQSAAVAALFIFVNSAAGLLGMGPGSIQLHPHLLMYVVFAVAGGFMGAYAGAHKYKELLLKRILSFVLFIAALKLLLS